MFKNNFRLLHYNRKESGLVPLFFVYSLFDDLDD